MRSESFHLESLRFVLASETSATFEGYNAEFETDLWEERQLRAIAVAEANAKFKGRRRIARKE